MGVDISIALFSRERGSGDKFKLIIKDMAGYRAYHVEQELMEQFNRKEGLPDTIDELIVYPEKGYEGCVCFRDYTQTSYIGTGDAKKEIIEKEFFAENVSHLYLDDLDLNAIGYLFNTKKRTLEDVSVQVTKDKVVISLEDLELYEEYDDLEIARELFTVLDYIRKCNHGFSEYLIVWGFN